MRLLRDLLFRMTGYANSRVRMQLSVRAQNLLIEEYPLVEKEITTEGNYWIPLSMTLPVSVGTTLA